MLETLIEQGKNLENKTSEGFGGPYFNTVEFEVWAAKGVAFLEREHCDSAVTDRVIEKYKSMNQNNNYDFYQLLQGALESHN